MKRRTNKAGIALVAVLSIILVVSAIVAIGANVALQRAFSAHYLCDRTRALAIAEAGANEAYARLCTNFDLRTDHEAFPKRSYREGWYDASIRPVGDSIAVISSTGHCNGVTVDVLLDVKRYTSTTPAGAPEGSAWEYAIFANQTLTVNGGSGQINGKMHSNAELRSNGGLKFSSLVWMQSAAKIRITGQASSAGYLHAPDIQCNPGPDLTVDVSPQAVIDFPTIDFTELYNTAAANGQIKSANRYKGTVNWTDIPGGVIWIPKSSVRFKSDLRYDCIIVCTGSIRIDGNSTFTGPSGTAGAIMSRDSTIRVGGNSTGSALLYAPKDITLHGTPSLSGQIMCGEDVTLSGNVDVINYLYTGDPFVDQGTEAVAVGISAWQK